ncbi:hypothetical protein [Corynebacterium flavescens]|uniref:hypothetical protein n=1 Tax=Corynebacterium flavescens TaxID=28028 RepID=UPI003FCEE7E9
MPSTTATNSAAIAATTIRKQEYELWQSIKPPLEVDVETECHCLSTTTGLSESKTKNIISALYRLEELPKPKELQELHFHLDLNRLITIDATLCKLRNDATDTLERIDAEIARYLTASRPCQHLPSARAIRN